MSFEVYYEVKYPWGSPFHNMHAFLEGADVWSSYSVENPLVPASEERNSTMDATLGTLKTRKAAVCRSVNFWCGTPSRGYHLEIFCKFQSTFEKFG